MIDSPPAPAKARPIIGAIVVTHNRLPKLRDTLTRLLAEDLDRVLVFDNASTDGTADHLAGLDDSRLIVHRSSDNLGGAGGFSGAMALMRDRL